MANSRSTSWSRLVDVADPEARVFEPEVWDFGGRVRKVERRGEEYGRNPRDTSVVERKGEGRAEEPR